MGKRLILTKHAAGRLLERNIPAARLGKMIEKGVRLEDKETGAVLRVYKEKHGKHYTLVVDEKEDQIAVITAYESSVWQIEQYRKVKKHESKVF